MLDRKEILLTLVQGEQAVEWAKGHVGWKSTSEESVCKWKGITCDPVSRAIIRIELDGVGFEGTIPSELGLLPSLLQLKLAENQFIGTIPPEVAQLDSLQFLNLGKNELEGTIPQFKGDLKSFDVNHNQMYGTLPNDFGGHYGASLIKLDLSHNEFSGTIPDSFAKMKFLNYWDMSHNIFEGSLPNYIGSLEELQGLFLDNNRFAGTIPPSMSRSSLKLVQIFLEHNRLSGTIPASLADLPALVDLFVDGNKFTGTVPPDLCNLNLNEDFFQGEFNVSGRDGCTSIACPANFVSKEGVHPCFECGNQGFSPYLGRNGRCFQMNQKMVLDKFYDSTDGPNWKNGLGWGMANVAVCDYEGVICNNAGKIVNITLTGNSLYGTIPDEVGFLRHLQVLNLADNLLTGFLPSDLRFAPLEELDVSGNQLVGFVPPMLCLTGDINGNGMGGAYNCDIITCSKGTWSPIGRATPSEGVETVHKCLPCATSTEYLGSTTCSSAFEAYNPSLWMETNFWIVVVSIVGTFFVAIVSLVVVYRRRLSVVAFDDAASGRISEYDSENGESEIFCDADSAPLEEFDHEPALIPNRNRVHSIEHISTRNTDAETQQRHSMDFSPRPLVRNEEGNERSNESGSGANEYWLDVPKIA